MFVVVFCMFVCCCFVFCMFVVVLLLFKKKKNPILIANITEICICSISLQSYISDFLLMALNIVHILEVIEKRKLLPSERKMDHMVRDLF